MVWWATGYDYNGYNDRGGQRDDNEVDGDGATGDKVNDDGNGATRDGDDDDDDVDDNLTKAKNGSIKLKRYK